MKVYESYVAESRARRRRRLAVGIVGAVMLATVALTALLVLNPPVGARASLAADCTSGNPSSAAACERAAHRDAV
jgi:hypothetical protein